MALEDRFWGKVERRGPDECWWWQAAKVAGYGVLNVGRIRDGTRRMVKAHRVSWQMSIGPIPKGMLVLHRCDNPSCVNPSHLFIGTNRDNVADMRSKGRGRYIGNGGLRGSAHGKSKLTEVGAAEIRQRVDSGESQASVARDFGLSRATINHIIKGRTWRHVDHRRNP